MEEQEFGIWQGCEIYKHSKGVEIPLIKGIANQGDIVCIQADEGVGKSVLGQQMMFDLTTASSFLDVCDIQRKNTVLWNMGESKKSKHIRRMNDMKRSGLKIDDTMWYFNNCSSYSLDSDEDFALFLERIKSINVKYDVMFFDSLYGFFDEDSNSNKPVKKFCKNIRKLAGMYDSTMFFMHHVNKDTFYQGKKVDKSKRVSGAKEWGAFFTTVYTLEKRNTGLHYLENNKDRDGDALASIPMYMRTPKVEGHLLYTMDTEELNDKKQDGKHKMLRIIKKGKCTATDLYNRKGERDSAKVSHSTYHRSIKELVNGGIVTHDISDDGRVWHELVSEG